MADILIRGMEMPADNGCYLLTVRYNEFGEMCAYPLEKMGGFDKRDTKFDTPLYPIVALPERHGRLIDADSMIEQINEELPDAQADVKSERHKRMLRDVSVGFIWDLQDAPTVVPADKEGAP